ncbi:unnamed protein product [Linum trigynum]|uniref:Uncharacterized protein n=1 Tax=Linum trigynum TaxID=586398 RepID=A0AAV2DV40_9ROSI
MVGLGSTAFFSHSHSGHRKLLGVGRDKGLESRPGTIVLLVTGLLLTVSAAIDSIIGLSALAHSLAGIEEAASTAAEVNWIMNLLQDKSSAVGGEGALVAGGFEFNESGAVE